MGVYLTYGIFYEVITYFKSTDFVSSDRILIKDDNGDQGIYYINGAFSEPVFEDVCESRN